MALYSVAAVSRLTLTTRHRDQEYGTQIRLEGGEVASQGRAGQDRNNEAQGRHQPAAPVRYPLARSAGHGLRQLVGGVAVLAGYLA